jgi:hypothetical protein
VQEQDFSELAIGDVKFKVKRILTRHAAELAKVIK